jgi:ATP-binding cassette subfamily B (MDR/TAP) protein 1
MAPGIQAINLGRQAAADIFSAIKRQPEIDASSEDVGIKLVGETLKGSLEFRNLVFAYPSRPSNTIFSNFNLRIEAGSSIALVGPSGSGKSTISKLLLRFYDPLAGTVLADDVPLKELNLKWWRSQIGYVQQEASLFPGTIRHNIAMGKVAGGDIASDEEVTAAAKAASAHDFIMELPDQYDTFYSGASIQLSGGQIQRIAIARALIRDPRILILDEATSALDSQSEKIVQDALANIRQHKKITTVTVAHRLSTIIHSDKIAVLDDGSIQQLGTHLSLLEEGGIYAMLCKSQGITAESLQEDDVRIDAGSESVVKEKVIPSGDKNDIEAPEHAPEPISSETGGEDEETASLSRLWEYSKVEWACMVLGVIGACIVGALPPCEGILFARLTSNFYTLTSEEIRVENRPLCSYFLILGAASLLGNMAMGCGFSVAGFRLTRRLRVLVFDKIVRHGMGWFDFPEHSTGELTSRLEEDAEAVSKVTGWSLGQQIQVIASLVVGITISLTFSWRIGLIALACVPVIMCAAFVQAICTQHKVIEQDGLSSATILERGLREISLVQAYNIQKDVCDQYCEALKPDAESKVKQGTQAGLVFGFSQFAIFGTFGALFYAGVQFMLQQKLTFTDFFTSLLAIMFSAIAIGQVSADFASNHKGLAAAARIFAIVDEPLDDDDPISKDGSKPDSFHGTVSFKSLGFSYPTRPGNPIYYPSEDRDGFNLSIQSKESVAFVGRSGCGKSTALQLLLRFYRASSGQVLLDDNNVQDLNLSWLRGKIGYVGQQPVLFAGSVRDNILLGKKNATEEEIINAAKAANAHEFITRLSHGYYTDIGTGGSLLSGGQKQRIAIARAIIKNPQILVLDEATSALDNESERVVQAALDDMQKSQPRTTLVVAHCLMTVKDCDKIAVLEDGGVIEFGSHSELLEKEGLYNDLWKKQGAEET